MLYLLFKVDDGHLSGSVIAHTLERHFRIATNTALHPGKDLAVSLLPFDRIIPEGTLAFRHRRHCSHL